MRTILSRKCNLEPVFVFDGPSAPIKLASILSRRDAQCKANALFMRSSPASRASPSFQSRLAVIPPLLPYVLLDALKAVKVEIIFGETEADSLVAEEAERRGGYAVSNDSDMYVLCSRGDGCGYVPLDSLEYLVKPPTSVGEAEGLDGDDGFEQVSRKGKASARRQNTRTELSQPEVFTLDVLTHPTADLDGLDDLARDSTAPTLHAVRFRSYSSTKLAAHLGIPSTFLPLLAAFVGNDYSSEEYMDLLSSREADSRDRISMIASLIRQEWLNLARGGPAAAKSPKSGSMTPDLSKHKPVKRLGLGRLSGPAFSTLAGAASDDGRSDGGRSSGTATPTTRAAAAPPPLAGRAASVTSITTVGATGFSAAQVSNALAVDPVRNLVVRVLDQILVLGKSRSANARLGRSTIAVLDAERYESSGERERLVNGLLDSVAAYSLLTHHSAPHLSAPTAEFFRKRSPSPEESAGAGVNDGPWWEQSPNRGVATAYQDAYFRGDFAGQLVDALTLRQYIARSFLEDPDMPSIHAGGPRKLRRWIWAVMFGAWGLRWARQTMEEPKPVADLAELQDEIEPNAAKRIKWIGADGYAPGQDPDELISVHTPSSYGADEGPLMKRMHEEEDDGEDAKSGPGSVVEADEEGGIKPAPAVTEWVRRGDRIKGEQVQILHLARLLEEEKQTLPPSLQDLLGQYEAHEAAWEEASSASASAQGSKPTSPQFKTQELPPINGAIPEMASDPPPPVPPLLRFETKREILFRALRTRHDALAEVPGPLQVFAATLRYIILEEADRLGESSKRYNWTPEELRAAIFASVWAARDCLAADARQSLEKRADACLKTFAAVRLAPTTRSIHLSSAVQANYEAAELLIEALLLVPNFPQLPTTTFESTLLHAKLLAGDGNMGSTAEEKKVYAFIVGGLEHCLGMDIATERANKKKAKKEAKADGQRDTQGSPSATPSRANMFDLLDD